MNDFLRFVTGPLPGMPLPATYNGWLVALPYVVAMRAARADHAARLRLAYERFCRVPAIREMLAPATATAERNAA